MHRKSFRRQSQPQILLTRKENGVMAWRLSPGNVNTDLLKIKRKKEEKKIISG